MVRALWPEATARWCAGGRYTTAGRCPSCLLRRGEGVGHGERRRELERQFPGWEIWYVPRGPDGATRRAPADADQRRGPGGSGGRHPGRGQPGHPGLGAAGLAARSRGQSTAAPRAGNVGRGCVAAREGPQKASGAASGFPAGGSAWRSLSGPGGRRGGPALADIAESAGADGLQGERAQRHSHDRQARRMRPKQYVRMRRTPRERDGRCRKARVPSGYSVQSG